MVRSFGVAEACPLPGPPGVWGGGGVFLAQVLLGNVHDLGGFFLLALHGEGDAQDVAGLGRDANLGLAHVVDGFDTRVMPVGRVLAKVGIVFHDLDNFLILVVFQAFALDNTEGQSLSGQEAQAHGQGQGGENGVTTHDDSSPAVGH
jgi:hypothetical protein